MTGGSRPHFCDRLAALVEERRSRVVLGLDPDPAALWPEAVARFAGAGAGGSGLLARANTAEAVTEHCRAAIVAAGPACVAVKLQLACFERLGAPGWEALERTVAIARDHGLLVLADGKRGDVPVTARAYAQALVGETDGPFGPVEGLGVDAFTANPLLGRDSLEPLIEGAAAAGAGCFVLVRTSNPGAAELQDQGDPPLHERLARLADELGAELTGDCGLSLVGAVTGATQPALLGRLRELMPRAVFLLPGVGAQGGRVGGPRPGVRAAPGRRARDRLALDRQRARRARRRPGRRRGRRGRGVARRRLGPLGRSKLRRGGRIDARRTTTKPRTPARPLGAAAGRRGRARSSSRRRATPAARAATRRGTSRRSGPRTQPPARSARCAPPTP